MPITDTQREALRLEIQRWLPKPVVEWSHTSGRLYDNDEDSSCTLRVVGDTPQGMPDYVETVDGDGKVIQQPQQRCKLSIELSLLSSLPDQAVDAYAKIQRAMLGLYSDVSRLALNAANVALVRRGPLMTSEQTEDQGIVLWQTTATIDLHVVYTLPVEAALNVSSIATADTAFASFPTTGV